MAGSYFKNGAVVESTTTTATAAGTTTLVASSSTYQQFTGTLVQTVVLPDATTLSQGRRFRIMNRSTQDITVNYNGGTLAATVSAGTQTDFLVISNGTSIGTWDVAAASGGSATTGVTFPVTAGETLLTNVPVYISQGGSVDTGRTAGQVYKLDPTNDARSKFAGFTTGGISSGGTGTAQSGGMMSGFSSLTPGATYYGSVTTPGATQTSIPEASGQWVVILGIALSATQMLIDDAGGESALKLTPQLDPRTNYVYFNRAAEVDTTGWTTYSDTQTVTITNASPAVFTVGATAGLLAGMPVSFTTTGTLPTGLTASTTYFVSTVIGGTTFKVSATRGGADVNTSSAGSGTHTFRPLVPITATSGSLTGLTFSRNTTTPLRGVADFKLAQTNSTVVAGQGVYYAFTIDPADKARMIIVSADFNADSNFSAADGTTPPNSGGVGDSDLEWFVYDVTNAILIPVSPQTITANGANNFSFSGTFQSASNSTSYRLCLHASKTSAAATGYNFRWDNVFIGPQSVARGAAITDWRTLNGVTLGSSSGSFTGAILSAQYRQVGDSYDVQIKITKNTNTSTFSGVLINFPFVIDSAKDQGIAQTEIEIGTYGHSSNEAPVIAAYNGPSAVLLRSFSGGAFATITDTSPFTWNSVTNPYIIVKFRALPVVGLSSSTTMSSDGDTRIVDFSGTIGTQAVTTNVTNIAVTATKDSHGAWNGTQFIVPVAGDYLFVGGIWGGSTVTSTSVFKNGTNTNRVLSGTDTGGRPQAGAALITGCVAGDVLSIRNDSSVTLSAGGHLGILRLSGPSAIAISETVSAKYNTSAGQSIPTSQVVVNFDNKLWDSHGAVTTGAAWKFTAPIAGKYQVNVVTYLTAAWTTPNSGVNGSLMHNGVEEDFWPEYVDIAGTSALQAQGSTIVNCLAGDTINFKLSSDVASNLSGVGSRNTISIVRVGN